MSSCSGWKTRLWTSIVRVFSDTPSNGSHIPSITLGDNNPEKSQWSTTTSLALQELSFCIMKLFSRGHESSWATYSTKRQPLFAKTKPEPGCLDTCGFFADWPLTISWFPKRASGWCFVFAARAVSSGGFRIGWSVLVQVRVTHFTSTSIRRFKNVTKPQQQSSWWLVLFVLPVVSTKPLTHHPPLFIPILSWYMYMSRLRLPYPKTTASRAKCNCCLKWGEKSTLHRKKFYLVRKAIKHPWSMLLKRTHT